MTTIEWPSREEFNLRELKEAAIEYGDAFAATDPKAHSDRRIKAHERLARAARLYAAAIHETKG